MKHKRIIIGGGGTGGHVFPAISIAQALRRKAPGTEILFVGAEGKLEMEKVPEAGFAIEGLPIAGFQRRLTWQNLVFFKKLWKSIRKSKAIIMRFKPDIAVGVGGYASGPILRAAARKNIPVVLQEQNSYAGVTNRILSGKAKKIFVAYEGMEKYFPAEKIIFTGNPVRKDIPGLGEKKEDAFRFFNLDNSKPVVLVTGGSLGAGTINESIRKNLDLFGKETQLIWQSGRNYYEELSREIRPADHPNIRLLPFIEDMKYAYAVADVIISRAGAGTISELALVGKPVILVPSPNVAEDHQTKNAMALVHKNAAILVADKDAGKELVASCMNLLADPEKRKKIAENILAMAMPDSADRIANEILSMV